MSELTTRQEAEAELHLIASSDRQGIRCIIESREQVLQQIERWVGPTLIITWAAPVLTVGTLYGGLPAWLPISAFAVAVTMALTISAIRERLEAKGSTVAETAETLGATRYDPERVAQIQVLDDATVARIARIRVRAEHVADRAARADRDDLAQPLWRGLGELTDCVALLEDAAVGRASDPQACAAAEAAALARLDDVCRATGELCDATLVVLGHLEGHREQDARRLAADAAAARVLAAGLPGPAHDVAEDAARTAEVAAALAQMDAG